MKLFEILASCRFGATFEGNVWPEVAGEITALRAVSSIPADIFFPIVRSKEFGIARKLRALASLTGDKQGFAPAFSSVHHFAETDQASTSVPAPYHFARVGAHGNLSARATERSLCSAWKQGQRLNKIPEATLKLALERADARRLLASGWAKPTTELYCKAW